MDDHRTIAVRGLTDIFVFFVGGAGLFVLGVLFYLDAGLLDYWVGLGTVVGRLLLWVLFEILFEGFVVHDLAAPC